MRFCEVPAHRYRQEALESVNQSVYRTEVGGRELNGEGREGRVILGNIGKVEDHECDIPILDGTGLVFFRK